MPEAGVVGAGEFGEHGIGSGLKPLDEVFEVIELHGGAAGGAVVFATADVEEDFVAGRWVRVVVVVLDEDEPPIGIVAEMHVLFFPPSGKRRAGREGVEVIVGQVGELGIIDPSVPVGDLVVRPVVRAVGELGRVAEDKADSKETRGIFVIAVRFLRSRLRRVEATAPGETALAEEDGPWFAVGLPLAGIVAMKKL